MNKLNFKGSVMLNPTPVVMVTSKNNEGKLNVFTVGWVSTVCTKEPMIAMGIRPERLSYDYIKESKECVINLPTRRLVKETDYCGVVSGRKEDKITKLGLKLDDGVGVETPSLAASPVALECTLESVTPLGTHDLFLFKVVNIKVDENLLDENNKICFNKAGLICYSHGEYFGVENHPLGNFGYSVRKKQSKENFSHKSRKLKSSKKNKKNKNISKKRSGRK